ncbi:MAG: tRNA preQ1(34) S-adenosylmethionine ribosyltransferase-isomerase QueA [Gammaproteobacteria bacterium]|nr:tRNA preQ1(34) S-adenosylmethionine ribosyltransferase-isomerase QueA [Gammaproteobacteria bacterium]MYC24728.1 tRNA preQ1(34) S-adenosylmethionine ribosyltransferase-isomerase QueA [Gammaproteobacteria bacterium]
MSERVFYKTDFDYQLPPELIALEPTAERTDSRLLIVDESNYAHCRFSSLPLFLRAGDVLVLNDTKVIPARLSGVKDSGGKVEILVERVEEECVALCHVKASRGLNPRHSVAVGQASVCLQERVGDLYRLEFDKPVFEILEKYGQVPLPPYIDRPPMAKDAGRYQTVYAREEGAVAAPTAGLHFDEQLLATIRKLGVEVVFLTLHIGAGTFQPLREENLSMVNLHPERYAISPQSLDTIRSRTGRCVAVGTTVVRTLEHIAVTNILEGETDLFIYPGFRFQEVDVLLTNFHLPQSSLIMLVSAFCGYGRTMQAYSTAVKSRYRFYSYGDVMWCERDEF